MNHNTIRNITLAGVVAAMYAVLGYFGDFFGLNFGPVQIRFAEALTVLPFLYPAAGPGLVVGCLITNLLSPYGPIDVIFGTLATAIAAYLTTKMPRWYMAAIPPVLVNAAILAPMWAWAETGAVNAAFWVSLATNAILFIPGEAIACWGLGTLLLRGLPRIAAFAHPKGT